MLGAVEHCGYYPNAHARSLAAGRSSTLGLLISDISNPLLPVRLSLEPLLDTHHLFSHAPQQL